MRLDAQWVAGFVDGEGCFHVSIVPHPEMTAGVQVLPEFTVVQHQRNIQVLHALKAYFRCGVVRRNHGDWMCYRVRNLKHLSEIIIPFFDRHPLKTHKRVDYITFRRVVEVMKRKGHLTPDGVARIRSLAATMNRRAIKVKSDCSGNGTDQSSEIPCRVSSDPHESCNDRSAVSVRDSAKL